MHHRQSAAGQPIHRTTPRASAASLAGRSRHALACAAMAITLASTVAACDPAQAPAGGSSPSPVTSVSSSPTPAAPVSPTSIASRTTAPPSAPAKSSTPPAAAAKPGGSGGDSTSGGSSSGGTSSVTHENAVPNPGVGPTAKCKDGTLSYSAHHQGTCSHHHGVAVWYK
jgi:hypothetical protein